MMTKNIGKSKKTIRLVSILLVATSLFSFPGFSSAQATVPVTIDNYNRAQSDVYFALIAKGGGFGKFRHGRDLAPIGREALSAPTATPCIPSRFSTSMLVR